jgi:hypothetical protein
MSEDRPNGWYRDDPSQQARPSFTPHPEAEGSPYEPTQAVPRGTAWPALGGGNLVTRAGRTARHAARPRWV